MRAWRRRGPLGLFALVSVSTLVVALTAATNPLSAAPFALSGHWVYNSVLRGVFHVDGATGNIDAQAAVEADAGSQVVQGDTMAWIAGLNRIIAFGKADMSAQPPSTPPVNELPVSVEGAGGPYLVYRNAGIIDRLGDPTTTVQVGGAVGDPILTPDGTVWVHRVPSGEICTLPKDAVKLSGCPVKAPENHPGALTVVGDRPAFVDLFTDTIHTIDGNSLSPGTPIGVPLSANVRAATHDVAGRVAILDLERHSLVLADPQNPAATPPPVALPGGDYEGPMSTGSAVVLVDRQSGNVLSYGPDGTPKDTKPIHGKAGKPRLSRGEDNRVYVEDADGTQVLVVAKDGGMRDVPVTGKPATPKTPTPSSPSTPDIKPEQPPQGGDNGGHQQQETGRPTHGGEPTSRPPAPPPIPPSPPGAPSLVSATAGDGSAVVTWGAAADNRAAVTSYQISWQGGSMTVSGSARRANVNGLTNGVRYVFTVTATNKAGTGPGASSGAVTPFAAAAAPVVNASNQGNSATVSWTAPDLRGGTLVNYLVSVTGQADKSLTGRTTSYSGLTAGQQYTFTVRAITRTADGQTLTGAPGSTKITIPAPPARTISITEGGQAQSGKCHGANCKWVVATLKGFQPGTHSITLSSSSNRDVQTENFQVDSVESSTYGQLDYDQPGQSIWVTVDGVTSNRIVWQ